jgi:hypothetical protein
MAICVALVVDDWAAVKLSGTATLPASPTSAVMFLYGLEPESPEVITVGVVSLKVSSTVEVVFPQLVLVLGVVAKPSGSVPV